MSNKTLSIISSVLTVLILILFGILSQFIQMLALNGANERQGVIATSVSIVCQGVGIILAAMLAWRLVDLAVTRFHWNRILAVIVAILVGTLLGGVISFLSVIIAIPIAGVR
jgi:hypothetical protein